MSEESPSDSCQRVFVRNCGFYRINEKYRQAGFHWNLQGKTKQKYRPTITFLIWIGSRVSSGFSFDISSLSSLESSFRVPGQPGPGLPPPQCRLFPWCRGAGRSVFGDRQLPSAGGLWLGHGPAVFFRQLSGPGLSATCGLSFSGCQWRSHSPGGGPCRISSPGSATSGPGIVATRGACAARCLANLGGLRHVGLRSARESACHLVTRSPGPRPVTATIPGWDPAVSARPGWCAG